MRDRLLLEHILEAIESMEEYVAGGRAYFFGDKRTQDAVLRNLHTMAESVARISPDTKARYSDVAWKDIAAFRNVVVHDYLALDLSIIWDVVDGDVPPLKSQVEGILKHLTGNEQ
ncbi:MAG: HepT-like ribonuclease domain-containing protein [Thermoleophilia bacterium]